MFPISDSIKSHKIPIVTIALVAVNLYVFVRQFFFEESAALISEYALIPASVDFTRPETLVPFVTSIFLHGDFMHILSNMWFLWVFGDNVESHLGKMKYLALFFLAGIAGGLLQYIFMTDSTIAMIGASGAVSGILGSYVVLFPHAKIKSFIVFLFYVSIVQIPATFYIFYWFFIQFFLGIASLPFASDSGGIAFWAHVGGFIGGLLLARKLRIRRDDEPIEGEIVEE